MFVLKLYLHIHVTFQSGDKSVSLSSSIHGSPLTTPSSSHSSLPREPSGKYFSAHMESGSHMNGHHSASKYIRALFWENFLLELDFWLEECSFKQTIP